MDHLDRTPLLVEFALPSTQRLKPGGASKARTRRLARTSAAMPHSRGEGKLFRRIDDKQRMNQARDIMPGLYGRRAQRDYAERRAKADHGHLGNKRKNPQAETRQAKRGNPQNKGATQVRISPSKTQRRPMLPRTLQFLSRGALLKGHRL